MKKREITIIGCGVFGLNLIELLNRHHEFTLIAIDKNKDSLKNVEGVTKKYVGNASSDSFLKTANLKGTNTFVVGMGSNIQESILTCLVLKENFPKTQIIAKSTSLNHRKILKNLGVEVVIDSEYALAKNVTRRLLSNINYLSNSGVEELLDISDEISIIKINAPKSIIGKKIKNINLDKTISIVSYHRDKKIMLPNAETILLENDRILLIGHKKNLISFIKKG